MTRRASAASPVLSQQALACTSMPSPLPSPASPRQVLCAHPPPSPCASQPASQPASPPSPWHLREDARHAHAIDEAEDVNLVRGGAGHQHETLASKGGVRQKGYNGRWSRCGCRQQSSPPAPRPSPRSAARLCRRSWTASLGVTPIGGRGTRRPQRRGGCMVRGAGRGAEKSRLVPLPPPPHLTSPARLCLRGGVCRCRRRTQPPPCAARQGGGARFE